MGKSTLSQLVSDRPVIGTDDYKKLPWEEVPLRMIADVQGMSAFVIEGVQVARALRKGLEVDAVVYLTVPKVKERKPGQVAMARGVRTVFDQWHTQNPQVPVFIEGARTPEENQHGNFRRKNRRANRRHQEQGPTQSGARGQGRIEL
jgi:hypothetical protein